MSELEIKQDNTALEKYARVANFRGGARLECSSCGEGLVDVVAIGKESNAAIDYRALCPDCNDYAYPKSFTGKVSFQEVDDPKLGRPVFRIADYDYNQEKELVTVILKRSK